MSISYAGLTIFFHDTNDECDLLKYMMLWEFDSVSPNPTYKLCQIHGRFPVGDFMDYMGLVWKKEPDEYAYPKDDID